MVSCSKCEGDKVASSCIIWEGKEYPFESFEALIEFLYDKVSAKSLIDLKTLSSSNDNSIENAVQILIDKEVRRASSSATVIQNNPTCNPNVSALDGCTTCNKSFCDKIQLMVNEIASLRAEVNQLKTQL